ncbi:MAG: hutH, partial [Nevskia sp.]|nr:hutH [Nevskia sp.]
MTKNDSMLIKPGQLTLSEIRRLAVGGLKLSIDPAADAAILASAATVHAVVAQGAPAYGINTGFGKLAKTHIPDS